MTHTPGFSAFWAEWPANRQGGYMRKGGRAECHKRWVKHHHESQAETILAHVRWMKTTSEWLKDNGMFIPMPITYLNQARWDGADIPPPPEQVELDREAIYQRQLAASIAAMQGKR